MSDKDIRKAVALQYNAPDAPKVVATGKGAIADAIVDKARQSGVPVEENPALVDALSTLKLDETIPIDLYKAVAAVIAAVLRAAKKA